MARKRAPKVHPAAEREPEVTHTPSQRSADQHARQESQRLLAIANLLAQEDQHDLSAAFAAAASSAEKGLHRQAIAQEKEARRMAKEAKVDLRRHEREAYAARREQNAKEQEEEPTL